MINLRVKDLCNTLQNVTVPEAWRMGLDSFGGITIHRQGETLFLNVNNKNAMAQQVKTRLELEYGSKELYMFIGKYFNLKNNISRILLFPISVLGH